MRRWVANLAPAAACALVAIGCVAPPPERARSSEILPLDAEADAFAEALARYSVGLAEEWDEQSASSFSNFQRAAELDPDHEELQFRVSLALIQQERPAEAIQIMERLAKRHPRSEKAHLWLAMVYHATGEYEHALGAYDRARRLNPTSTVTYLQKAELLARMNRLDEAIAQLREGMKKVDAPLELYEAWAPLELARTRMALTDQREPKHLAEAIAAFEKILADHPADRMLRETLGRFYILAGQAAKAVEAYAPLEKERPDDLRQSQQLALSFLLSPDPARTMRELDRLIEKEPANARAHYYLGIVFEQAKMLEEASEMYRRAITLEPKWAAPYLRRVVMQVAQQETEEAILTLEDGLQVQPDELRFLELLAYIYMGRRDIPEAISAFERAQKVIESQKRDPISETFYLSYAFALQLGGQIAEAARQLRTAYQNDPTMLEAYIQYTFRSESATNIASSLRVLENLAETSPAPATVLAYQGLLLNYGKEYAKAIAAFTKAEKAARAQEIEEDVLTPTFYFWYASACERQGEFDRAVQLFKQVLADKPDPENSYDFKSYVDALNYLAYMWAERAMNLEEALQRVNEALEYRPDNAAFLDTRGWIYFQQQRYEEARVDIRRALDLLPGDATITDHMGDIEAKLGRPEETLGWWKKSFMADPTNTNVAEKLRTAGEDVTALRKEAEHRSASNTNAPSQDEALLPFLDLGQELENDDQDALPFLPQQQNPQPAAP